MKVHRQIKISEEAKERLQNAAYALRLSFNVLEKTCSVASIAFKQAGPAMEKALKKCKPDHTQIPVWKRHSKYRPY